MMSFQIVKEAEKTYKLKYKLPEGKTTNHGLTRTIERIFSSISEAEDYAHEFCFEAGEVVKEFSI